MAKELKDFRYLVGFLEKQLKTESCYVDQARLKLRILQPPPPKSCHNIIGMHTGEQCTSVKRNTEHKDQEDKSIGDAVSIHSSQMNMSTEVLGLEQTREFLLCESEKAVFSLN